MTTSTPPPTDFQETAESLVEAVRELRRNNPPAVELEPDELDLATARFRSFIQSLRAATPALAEDPGFLFNLIYAPPSIRQSPPPTLRGIDREAEKLTEELQAIEEDRATRGLPNLVEKVAEELAFISQDQNIEVYVLERPILSWTQPGITLETPSGSLHDIAPTHIEAELDRDERVSLRASPGDGQPHPHGDEDVCMGEWEHDFNRLMSQFEFVAALDVFDQFWRSYDPRTAFFTLDGSRCSNCDSAIEEDEECSCEECGEVVCRECINVGEDGTSLCEGCTVGVCWACDNPISRREEYTICTHTGSSRFSRPRFMCQECTREAESVRDSHINDMNSEAEAEGEEPPEEPPECPLCYYDEYGI